ncbi:MAG: molybdopterin oxidoreductase, partial [Deltaproteobacteria bacterium]|nr:molybdopterin oxidoreductase [Deltaproteobacteria bacterium]
AIIPVRVNREGSTYEESTMFSGYPAKRPWYPFTGNLYQEVIPSANDGYPYPIKVLFLHMGTPVFSTPAGHRQIAILKNPKIVPLFIACDILIGETSMFADYVFPDTTYLERWESPGASTPAMLSTLSKVRQPVIGPLPEIVKVDGMDMPINMEAILIALGKKLRLPGFGKDALGPGKNFDHQDDWYLKNVANIAMGDKEGDSVPAADKNEMDLFRVARSHLPKSVFDEDRWMNAAGADYWPHVVYVLNRGGRFEDAHKMYKADMQAHPFSGIFQVFVERVASGRNSISGQQFDGLPVLEGPSFSDGKRIVKEADYPFQLITFKEIFGGQSRTMPMDQWLSELCPGNAILLNHSDADKLGLSNGERVRLSSVTNPSGSFDLGNGEIRHVEGIVKALEGLRPGVVAVAWHFGHWASGSRDMSVDGSLVKGNPRRSRGFTPNPVMLEHTIARNVCLTDPIGGSASFNDTYVKIVRI